MSTTPEPDNIVSDQLVELGGLRFHFRDWQSVRGDAPALILLHGLSGHARGWDAFARAMTDRYRVLALDMRGHGETQWSPDADYTIEAFQADLAAFVAALELDRFALLGLSLGALVALRHAAADPLGLDAFVLVDFAPELAPEGLARIRANVFSSDVFDSPEEAFALSRRDNDRGPPALQRKRSDEGMMRLHDGRWTYRYDRALRRPGVLELPPSGEGWRAAADIRVPTLIVRGGDSDILSPDLAGRLADTIPDCRLATIPDATHAVPFDAPDSFLSAVRDFLKG